MRCRTFLTTGVLGALLAALLAASLLAAPGVAQSVAAGPASAAGDAPISATLTAVAPTPAPVPAPPFKPSGPVTAFVQRAGTRFVVAARGTNGTASNDACETFNFVGWNTFYLMLRAADPRAAARCLRCLTRLRRWA